MVVWVVGAVFLFYASSLISVLVLLEGVVLLFNYVVMSGCGVQALWWVLGLGVCSAVMILSIYVGSVRSLGGAALWGSALVLW